MDEILSSVTLYWLTETFPRSIYPYRQVSLLSAKPKKKSQTFSYQGGSYLLPALLELMRTLSGISKSLSDIPSSRRNLHQSLRLGLNQLALSSSIASTRVAVILLPWKSQKFCSPTWRNFSSRCGNNELLLSNRSTFGTTLFTVGLLKKYGKW